MATSSISIYIRAGRVDATADGIDRVILNRTIGDDSYGRGIWCANDLEVIESLCSWQFV